jgi:hypothetical protein
MMVKRTRLLTFIAWSHLIAGLVGLVAAAWPGLLGIPTPPPDWRAIACVLYTLSIASGIALLRRHQAARALTSLVEGAQLVAFHTGHSGYLFYSGFQVLLLFTPSRVNVSANVQAQFGIGAAMQVVEPFVAIDVVTLLIWWILWRAGRSSSAILPRVADESPSAGTA